MSDRYGEYEMVNGGTLNSALDTIAELEARIKNLADLIHYPKHWDTACYPTLEHALHEIGCSECRS